MFLVLKAPFEALTLDAGCRCLLARATLAVAFSGVAEGDNEPSVW